MQSLHFHPYAGGRKQSENTVIVFELAVQHKAKADDSAGNGDIIQPFRRLYQWIEEMFPLKLEKPRNISIMPIMRINAHFPIFTASFP